MHHFNQIFLGSRRNIDVLIRFVLSVAIHAVVSTSVFAVVEIVPPCRAAQSRDNCSAFCSACAALAYSITCCICSCENGKPDGMDGAVGAVGAVDAMDAVDSLITFFVNVYTCNDKSFDHDAFSSL